MKIPARLKVLFLLVHAAADSDVGAADSDAAAAAKFHCTDWNSVSVVSSREKA